MKRRKQKPPVELAPARGPRVRDFLFAHAGWLVVIVGLLTFAGALRNGFTFDDKMVVEDAQTFLREPGLWSALVSRDYFGASQESTYRPMVTLSYIADYSVLGLEPLVFHLQSLLWHLGVALLLLSLARRLLPEAPPWAPLFAALIFVVHPVTTEAVDNVSFREDLLSTFFSLAAIRLALERDRVALALALGCYGLALFSKESAIVMPLLLVGAHACTRGAPDRAPVARLQTITFALVTLFYLVIRFGPMHGNGSYGEYPGGALWPTLLAMPRAFAHYLRLLVAPWPLCADYSGVFDFSRRSVSLATLAAIALLSTYGAATLWLWRRHRAVGFGLAWFALALGPVANLIPLPIPIAERFLYLPLVGIALALAAAAATLPRLEGRARPAALAAAGAALIGLAAITNLRHPVWHDNLTLWRTTAEDFPSAWGAHHGYGTELRARGELAEAQSQLELALRLKPTSHGRALIENDLGIVYGMEGRFDDSLAILRQALARHAHEKTYLNLGITLAQKGDLGAAEENFRKAIQANALYGRAYVMLADLKIRRHELDEAAGLLARARAINPADPLVATEMTQLERARGSPAPGITP